ncbi:MAG TPA: hypothetical protein VF580_15640 [Thermoanaerobaculia bacterium]
MVPSASTETRMSSGTRSKRIGTVTTETAPTVSTRGSPAPPNAPTCAGRDVQTSFNLSSGRAEATCGANRAVTAAKRPAERSAATARATASGVADLSVAPNRVRQGWPPFLPAWRNRRY